MKIETCHTITVDHEKKLPPPLGRPPRHRIRNIPLKSVTLFIVIARCKKTAPPIRKPFYSSRPKRKYICIAPFCLCWHWSQNSTPTHSDKLQAIFEVHSFERFGFANGIFKVLIKFKLLSCRHRVMKNCLLCTHICNIRSFPSGIL